MKMKMQEIMVEEQQKILKSLKKWINFIILSSLIFITNLFMIKKCIMRLYTCIQLVLFIWCAFDIYIHVIMITRGRLISHVLNLINLIIWRPYHFNSLDDLKISIFTSSWSFANLLRVFGSKTEMSFELYDMNGERIFGADSS